MTNVNDRPEDKPEDKPENKPEDKPQDKPNDPPTITQAQLDEMKAGYEADLKTAQSQIDRITAMHEKVVIGLLPESEQEAARKLLDDARASSAEEARTDSLSEKELSLTARELAQEYSSYGVTAESLLKEENGVKPTPDTMRVRAMEGKVAFLENGGKVPANPTNLPSDKGGGGAGGGAGAGDGTPKLEGKGDKAVLQHFADIRKFREEARSR